MNNYSNLAQEGSPEVEQAERQVLGETNYQKAEVVHRFADTHPWFHPVLLVSVALVMVGIGYGVRRHFKMENNHSETM